MEVEDVGNNQGSCDDDDGLERLTVQCQQRLTAFQIDLAVHQGDQTTGNQEVDTQGQNEVAEAGGGIQNAIEAAHGCAHGDGCNDRQHKILAADHVADDCAEGNVCCQREVMDTLGIAENNTQTANDVQEGLLPNGLDIEPAEHFTLGGNTENQHNGQETQHGEEVHKLCQPIALVARFFSRPMCL